MWEMIAAVAIWANPPEAPYVSCIDGHIARTLAECPTPHKTEPPQPPTGGGPHGGLLGGLLGGIGL